MYVDSVYVKHFQEVAQLISPKTMAPVSGCLSFYYQLKQESSIVFTVYLRDMSGSYEEIWKTDSALNADWALAEVDFNAPYPMEVKQSFLHSPAEGSELPGCLRHESQLRLSQEHGRDHPVSERWL